MLTAVVPFTLDPTRAYYVDSTAIMNLVTRALTQYVYDPETNDMVLAPDMATDLGRPNEDNTEWTFTLRDGLKYEDGTDVKAEDVAYAISRSFAIEELPDGPTYQLQFFQDGDTYKGPYKDKAPYKGVVVSGNDITIKMSQPFPEMDYYASFPVFTGIPQAKDTKEEYGNHPLATGPYMFEDYKPGSSLTLVKNPNWDPATDPGRIQSVDKWVFKFGEDTAKIENTILVGHRRGSDDLDLRQHHPADLQEDHRRRSGAPGGRHLAVHVHVVPRHDEDHRHQRAQGHRLRLPVRGRLEGRRRDRGPDPRSRHQHPAPGHRWSRRVRRARHRRPGHRPREGQGAARRRPTRWATRSSSSTPPTTRCRWPAKDQLVKGLEAGGFTATPIASTVEKIREARSDHDSPINVRSSGWCSDWPSGGSWFPAQWDGALVGLEGMPNPANFKEADADAKQKEILGMPADEVPAAWGEFDKFMQETYYPAVVTGYSGTAIIRGSKIGGMFNDAVRGMPTFADMYITQ